MTFRRTVAVGLCMISSACGSASPTPEAGAANGAPIVPSVRAAPTSTPSAAEAEPIPVDFRGEWAPADAGCVRETLADADGRATEPVRAPGGLVIGAAQIRFDEGIARIAEARAVPGGITLTGTFLYVDESPYAATLRLVGDRLMVAGAWGEDAFVRCSPPASNESRP